MALQLIMTLVLATTAPGCSWAHPGANPYRGEPAAALADFDMPPETRSRLSTLMRAHRYTDVVTITRDRIVGDSAYDDLREMHSGHGETCHGSVDRSAWSDKRRERGLVYCDGDTCVIVPTICNNVSLVTRRRGGGGAPGTAEGDGPIDINPSAGPPRAAAAEPGAGAEPDAVSGGGLAGTPADAPALVLPSEAPAGGVVATPAQGDTPPLVVDTGPGPAGPTGGSPFAPGEPGGWGGGGVVIGGGGGGTPSFPGLPTGPVSPVPEPASWSLFLAGLLMLAGAARSRTRRTRAGA